MSKGIACVRPRNDIESASPGYASLPLSNEATPHVSPSDSLPIASPERERRFNVTYHPEEARETLPQTEITESASLGQLPRGKELDDLIDLYFSTVHRESLSHLIILRA